MKPILFFVFVFSYTIIFSKTVDISSAKKVANALILISGNERNYSLKNIFTVNSSENLFFYVAELTPIGYMIISADDRLPAVIAYSFQNNLDQDGKFIAILKKDISYRMNALSYLPAEIIVRRNFQWKQLVSDVIQKEVAEQWPPAGSTTTGGWLESNWNQSSPYNQMCPIDPVSLARSYTGCPATAMAMVLNFHNTTNNTHFSDGDDYYHSYSGRNFWIDNDFAQHGFPSFPQLNDYLDTLTFHYQNSLPLTNQDKAALSFACGVAAKQVYTSSGSGTFGVSQAFDSYIRFGCTTISLLLENDTSLYTRLIQNMKDTLPAHLALVDEAWSTGHNVVVDGYNTDNYFHVNFGWGGSNNGWYLLPDEMPYSLTVVEGLILDIMKTETTFVNENRKDCSPNIYPNPSYGHLFIKTDEDISFLKITDINGRLIYTENNFNASKSIDISKFHKGIYIIQTFGKNIYTKKIVLM